MARSFLLTERTGWSLIHHLSDLHSEASGVNDHPVCGAKERFAVFYFLPQPPLLYEEGNMQP
jgi:hypothetical protein